jgi:hypothetical protein
LAIICHNGKLNISEGLIKVYLYRMFGSDYHVDICRKGIYLRAEKFDHQDRKESA